MQSLDQLELQRYSRHFSVIGVEGQQRLKNAKVLCVGGGGLGCPALQYLAACGVGTLGIMDEDKIEISNLQRQILFSEHDVGRNKAVVIGERLSALNSALNLAIYQQFLSEVNAQEIIAQYDIVLDASDNYPTRYLLNDICRSLKKPLISASIFQFEAQLSVFNFKEGPCYQCLYPEPPPPNSSPNCSLSGVLGVVPGVAGCLQAMEAIKIIINSEEVLSGSLLSINLLTMQFKQFEIQKQHCAHHPKINYAHNHNTRHCMATQGKQEITAQELAKLLSQNSNPVQLLDVRESFEREICHIGGLHIPLSLFTSELAKQSLQTTQPIIVYCKSGVRSATVCQHLREIGFNEVYNLTGGILNWIRTVDDSLRAY